jgi:uncharacterized protein YlxW (UPF0749 family)
MHPGTGHIVEFTVGRATGKQDAGRALRCGGISRQTATPGTRIAFLQPGQRFIAMNRILLTLFLAIVLVVASMSVAQTPDANQEARLLALVKEVQTQQAQLAENQAKIEEKIAAVSDIVKDARLYSKRVR